MAGISGRSLKSQYTENKYRYNGIEYDSSFGIDAYEAFYRDLDPQTGRWWQIDPKSEMSINPKVTSETEGQKYVEGLESISPYASMNDDPAKYQDHKGDASCCETAAMVWQATQQAAQGADPEIGAPLIEAVGTIGTVGAFLYDALSYQSTPPPSAPVILDKPATKPIILTLPADTKKPLVVKQTGSYTNTHQSGKRYHGKGGQARAKASADRIAKEHNDPVVNTDWTPSKNDREAFKDESKRLKDDGGHQNKDNYNKRDSPGSKYREQDKNKRSGNP